jgi:hypothetical protein
MATVAATSATGQGSRALTLTTLTSSDTFTYNKSKKPLLYLYNVTGGALTVTIDGDGGTTVGVSGVGDVSVASGYSTGSIPGGEARLIPLNSIYHYLAGTIEITGGTGIKAALVEY